MIYSMFLVIVIKHFIVFTDSDNVHLLPPAVSFICVQRFVYLLLSPILSILSVENIIKRIPSLV